jgi:hypothetical protein
MSFLQAAHIFQQLEKGRQAGNPLEESLSPLLERLCDQQTFGAVMKVSSYSPHEILSSF